MSVKTLSTIIVILASGYLLKPSESANNFIDCSPKEILHVQSFSSYFSIFGYDNNNELICQDIYSINKCGENNIFQRCRHLEIEGIVKESSTRGERYKAWGIENDKSFVLPNLDSVENQIYLPLDNNFVFQGMKFPKKGVYPITAWGKNKKTKKVSILKIHSDHSYVSYNPNLQKGIAIKDMVFNKLDSSMVFTSNLKDKNLNDQYVFLFKLNKDGEKVWERHIGKVETFDKTSSIYPLTDSSYLSTSLTDSTPLVSFVNTKGEIVFDTLIKDHDNQDLSS